MPTLRTRHLLLIPLLTIALTLAPLPVQAQPDTACGTLPPRLQINGRARVITESGETLRLRTAPSLNAGTSVRLGSGDELIVLQGPVCADGLRWWQLQTANGLPGWTAEGRDTAYFLAPVTGPTITPTPPPSATPTPTPTVTLTPSMTLSPTVTLTPSASPTPYPTITPSPTLDALCWTAPLPRLQPGDTAIVARNIQGLRLRALPAVGAGEERLLRPGTPFTVETGPICNMGYYWYRVTLDADVGGWLAEGEGAAYWAIPETPPTFSPDQMCAAWADDTGLHITQDTAALDVPGIPAATLRFAPNGRFLAALSLPPEQVFTIIDLATGEPVLTLPLMDALPNVTGMNPAGWLPDSSAMIFNGTDHDGQPAIWQISVHGATRQLPVEGWQAAETFPGDLPYVALTRPTTWEVGIFDTTTNKIIQTYSPATLPDGTTPATTIQWLTNGELYATFRATPEEGPPTIQAAVRLNPASSGVTAVAVPQPITQIVWADSGTPVVYTLTNGDVLSAPNLSAPATVLHTIPAAERATSALSLSPDGTTALLIGDTTAKLLSLTDGARTALPIPEGHILGSAAWLAADTLRLTTHPANAPDVTALWVYNTQAATLTALPADPTTAYVLSPSGCWFPEE